MKWNVLAVDDDNAITEQIKEFLESETGDTEFSVDTISEFDDAFRSLDKMLYDLIILDVFRGRQAKTVKSRPGRDILNEIRNRCFIPVVFYTALPSAVNEHKSDIVQVVHKTAGGLDKLKDSVKELLSTDLPKINRALINHFFKVQAEYMWKFVEPNWAKFHKDVDTKSLAYLLSRRLSWSFARENIHSLIQSLGDTPSSTKIGIDYIHPIECYIYPPLGTQFNTGDILFRESKKDFFVIITPSCDMFQDDPRKVKSEYVLVARCNPLKKTDEGKTWIQKVDKKSEEKLMKFMKNNKEGGQKERYYFLPETVFIPSLFVDFQDIITIPFSKLNELKKITTLDSPFAECLLNKFCRYVGRIGTPDIHQTELDGIIGSLKKTKKRK